MCGISGIVDLAGARPVDQELLRAMNRRMSHRGPDGEGYHFAPGVGLGHRRLSIIDIAGGHQPLFNEDGAVALTYNGEIYNFQELRSELQSCGHVFRTHSDSEVIVHAWEQWGTACVDRFNGMFAFAVWDNAARTAFIARDRIGIKPLYYGVTTDGFLVFASELKSLLLVPTLLTETDPEAVENYFTFGYVPDPKSIYRSVRKLAPGHYLELRAGSQTPVQKMYWDIDLSGHCVDHDADATSVVENLKQSVSSQLVSDVPLGAFLSGGIDSSAVVAMMHVLGADPILTCSIGFEEDVYDETSYADMVAQSFQTDHRSEKVRVSDFSLLEKLGEIYDEPFADSSSIPTYRVCQLARRHVTVALSGDGGDEDFIGYRRYRLFAMEDRVRRRIPLSVRQALFEPMGKYYPKLDWAPRFVRAKTTFQSLARDTASAYLHAVSICPSEIRNSIYSESFKQKLQDYRSDELFYDHIRDKSFSDNLRMAQYLDYKTYLPGDILTKVDRASMANSLEVRVPFLDHTVVEHAASLPTYQKLCGASGKHILKKALEPHLPNDVLYRKKMGFAVPIEQWFRTELREPLQQAVMSERMLDTGIFEPAGLRNVLQLHISGKRNFSHFLWAVLMFEQMLARRG